MATKRKRDDDKPFVNSPDGLRVLLYRAITSHGSAEVALLHIMKQYFIYVSVLQQVLEGPSSILLFLFGNDLGSNRLFRRSNKNKLL